MYNKQFSNDLGYADAQMLKMGKLDWLRVECFCLDSRIPSLRSCQSTRSRSNWVCLITKNLCIWWPFGNVSWYLSLNWFSIWNLKKKWRLELENYGIFRTSKTQTDESDNIRNNYYEIILTYCQQSLSITWNTYNSIYIIYNYV